MNKDETWKLVEQSLPQRLRDFAFNIDDDICHICCSGRCLDKQCIIRVAADIIDEYLKEKYKNE